MASDKVQVFSDANFQASVLQAEKPVLVDFWAAWCGPCRMVSPTIEEIAKENEDIKVGKINVDEESELAAKYSIMSIPTIMVLKEGKVSATAVGVRPKNEYLKMLQV